MNILHHKSWHIRNKRNIDRVRRDEEKHAKEQNDLNERHATAERERLYNTLRGKSSSVTEDMTNALLPSSKNNSHGDSSINVERQKELEEQDENLKFKLGAIQNLGQSDLKRKKPLWYNVKPSDKMAEDHDYDVEERRLNKRLFDDPIKNIPRSCLNSRHDKPGSNRLKPRDELIGRPSASEVVQISDDEGQPKPKKSKKSKKEKKSKKSKKSKKEKRSRKHSTSSDDDSDKEDMQAKMQMLRAQRLAREKSAREQAEFIRSKKSMF